MSAREQILGRVRTALGRMTGEPAAPRPEFDLEVVEPADRIALFCERVEALAGRAHVVDNRPAAKAAVQELLAGRSAAAADHPLLASAGILDLPGVQHAFPSTAALRSACSSCEVGITSASYGLADTGTLVAIAGPTDPRLVSLLPPVHIAVIPASSILAGLEELFLRLPDPAASSSLLVLITGPSRTADIEQILVRGVHGPGEIHVVIIRDC